MLNRTSFFTKWFPVRIEYHALRPYVLYFHEFNKVLRRRLIRCYWPELTEYSDLSKGTWIWGMPEAMNHSHVAHSTPLLFSSPGAHFGTLQSKIDQIASPINSPKESRQMLSQLLPQFHQLYLPSQGCSSLSQLCVIVLKPNGDLWNGIDLQNKGILSRYFHSRQLIQDPGAKAEHKCHLHLLWWRQFIQPQEAIDRKDPIMITKSLPWSIFLQMGLVYWEPGMNPRIRRGVLPQFHRVEVYAEHEY